MATREEVYEAINSERDYQEFTWSSGNDPASIGNEILLIEEYITKARAQWTIESAPEHKTVDILRKVAGIAVRCMEHHGAPKRRTI